jgi:serine/threonine-protein kinase PknG
MGGVRRIDDEDSPIYGTVGYQAPEIAADGPSPSSDLYTVGRALAVLTFEFTGYTGTYQHTLPDPATVPLLAQQESFYRLLRRATNPDPGRRFASAGDMAEQLTGVLREVLAAGDGTPRPAFSSLFSPELQAVGAEAGEMDGSEWASDVTARPPAAQIVAGLPVPQVDITDPAAGYLATLGTLDPAQITATLSAAVHGEAGTPPAVAESAETRLALARALIVTGALGDAGKTLAELAAQDSADWRITWYQGLRELASGQPAKAQAAFDAVYDALPGEPAPQLALGFAAEAAGDQTAAGRYFGRVWMVDRAYVSAAFGLARARLAADDRAGAIAALAAVPPTSSHHVVAQVAAVRISLARAGQPGAGFGELREAAGRLERLPLDAARRQQLTSEILQAGLEAVTAGQPAGDGRLLGCEPAEYPLRSGLERSYRALARLAPDQARRIELVDQANEVRPRTWL